jgi:Tfp pilus assembly protein PilN
MIEVNLHPEGVKAKAKRRRQQKGRPVRGRPSARSHWMTAMMAVLVGVPLLMAAFWFLNRSRDAGLQEQLEVAVADSARMSDLRALSDSLTERQQLIRDRVGIIRTLDEGRFVWPHVLDEVSEALPNFVWLTSLQEISPLPSLTIEIRGMAATALAVTEYVRRLEASPYLGFVRILGSQQQEAENAEIEVHAFTLLVDYTPPPVERGTESAAD